MANPERAPAGQASAVASCAATDCRHNEDRSCTAGEISTFLTDLQNNYYTLVDFTSYVIERVAGP